MVNIDLQNYDYYMKKTIPTFGKSCGSW